MTDPIATLKEEHRWIERVLDALDAYAGRARGGADLDPGDLAGFVRLARELVDGRHHGKEEDLLFAALVDEGGLPTDMGPVAVMLDEHEQGRHAIATLAELAERGALDRADRALLADTVTGWSRLLRAHILKEDGVLYPIALSRLDGAVMDELGRQFDRFARTRSGEPEREELLRLTEELAERYGAACGCRCACS